MCHSDTSSLLSPLGTPDQCPSQVTVKKWQEARKACTLKEMLSSSHRGLQDLPQIHLPHGKGINHTLYLQSYRLDLPYQETRLREIW